MKTEATSDLSIHGSSHQTIQDHQPNPSKNNFGLHIVRGTAILLVLICHCGIPNKEIKFQFGYYGVELFFALSGFLIGQIIIRDILENPSYKNLFTFYKRRWLRTLPLYYLVLILMIIIAYQHSVDFDFPFGNFFFVQNFSRTMETFFPVSWSLSIEEWSYLLIPFLLLSLPIRKHSGRSIMIFLVAFALVILLARIIINVKFRPDYDFSIRKSIPLQLDAIIYGFAIANIKLNFPKWFRFFSHGAFFMITLLIFVVLNFFDSHILVYNFIDEKTTPARILLALLLPFLSTSLLVMKLGKWTLIRSFFTSLSKYSYCLYLIHLTIFEWIIISAFASWHWLLEVAVAFTIVLLIAAASYRFFEKPILDWRDRNVRIST